MEARPRSGGDDLNSKLDAFDEWFDQNQDDDLVVSKKKEKKKISKSKSRKTAKRSPPDDDDDDDDDEKKERGRLATLNNETSSSGALESLMMSQPTPSSSKPRPPPSKEKTLIIGSPETPSKKANLLKNLKGKFSKSTGAPSQDDDDDASVPASQILMTSPVGTPKPLMPSTTRMVPKQSTPKADPLWASAMTKQSLSGKAGRRGSLDQTYAQFSSSTHKPRGKLDIDSIKLSKSMHAAAYTEAGMASPVSARGRSRNANALSMSVHAGMETSSSSNTLSALERRKQRHELSMSTHDDGLQSSPAPRSRSEAPRQRATSSSVAIVKYSPAPAPAPAQRPRSPRANSNGPRRTQSLSATQRRARPGMKRDKKRDEMIRSGTHNVNPGDSGRRKQMVVRREDSRGYLNKQRSNSLGRQNMSSNPQQIRNKPRRTKEGPPPTSSSSGSRRQLKGHSPPPISSSSGARRQLMGNNNQMQMRSRSNSNVRPGRRKTAADRALADRKPRKDDPKKPVGPRRSLSMPRKPKFGRSTSATATGRK